MLAFLNSCSYNEIANKRSEGDTMQEVKAHSLLNKAPLLTRVVGQLFDDEPLNTAPAVRLLNPPSARQRQQFIQTAIQQDYTVFLQLLPASDAGRVENVRGRIKPLRAGRYLVKTDHASYMVRFDQVRYIAHLD